MVLPARRGGVRQKSVKSKSGAFWMRFVQSGHPWNQGINDFGQWFAPLVFVVLFQLMDIH